MPAVFSVIHHQGIEQQSLDGGPNSYTYTVPGGIADDDILIVRLPEMLPGSVVASAPSGLTAIPSTAWAYRRLDGTETGTNYAMSTGESWVGTGHKGVDWWDAWIIRSDLAYTSITFVEFTGETVSMAGDPDDATARDDDNSAGQWPRTEVNRFSVATTEGSYIQNDGLATTPGTLSADSVSPALSSSDFDHLEQAPYTYPNPPFGDIDIVAAQTAIGTGVALDNAGDGIEWTYTIPGDQSPDGSCSFVADRLEVRLGGVTEPAPELAPYWGVLAIQT